MTLSARDEVLVLSAKPDRVVIVPKPKSFAKRMAGLHREIWQGAEAYLGMSARAGDVQIPGGRERVLIDTSVWIYHLEQHPQLGAPAGRVVEQLEEGKFRGVISELTLLELTVRPLQLGRQDIADDYEVLLDYFSHLELVPITRNILLEAAALRARQRLRTPDAIRLATGLRAGATLAVTNDEAWRGVPLIETAILAELIR